MKFRKDFVTNSSSSSFVCEICGREESGWDMVIEEAEMYECVNGHVFCVDEVLEADHKKMIQYILENGYNKACCNEEGIDYTEEDLCDMDQHDLITITEDGSYCVPEMVCPICQFTEYSEYDMKSYLRKEFEIPEKEVFALIKEKNKRRKKLYDLEYIQYVCEKKEINPIKVVEDWKNRFNSYKEFSNYINS